MTELTFAELTALIAANGLIVNDRYLITDKNWTIIAIATNAYRIVVPIVTEVTKAQLDALVAADGLNEGLQYKVTDMDWLLIATSNNTLTPLMGFIKINSGNETIRGGGRLLPIEWVPDYILVDNILIDCGLIDTNGLSFADEISLLIETRGGFFLDMVYFSSETTYNETLTISDDNDGGLVEHVLQMDKQCIRITAADANITGTGVKYYRLSNKTPEPTTSIIRLYLDIQKSKI